MAPFMISALRRFTALLIVLLSLLLFQSCAGGGSGSPDSAPTPVAVALETIRDGDVLTGTQTLSAAMSGAQGSFDFRFEVDGITIATLQSASPASLSVDFSKVLDGRHTLTVTATGSDGRSVSDSRQFVTRNIAAIEGIPSEYQSLYGRIETILDEFDSGLDRDWNRNRFATTFGFQLFTANCHRGEDLLAVGGLPGNILLLDQLQRMGIKGVTIAISYPILMPDFPRSGEYLQFYKALAAAVRSRGMVLNVESGLMFGQGGFTSLPVAQYYNSVRAKPNPYSQYVGGRGYVNALIATELNPDYLNFGAEPDVEALLTGLPLMADPAVSISSADYIAKQIQTANPRVLKGPGIAAWLSNAMTFVEGYLAIPEVDLLDIHIYPVNFDSLPRTLQLADYALARGKKLTVSEIWLYKELDGQIGGGDVWNSVQARDYYSFFEPLDMKLHNVLFKLTQFKRFSYVAPFWTKHYFAYLGYGEAKNLSIADRISLGETRTLGVLLDNAANPAQQTYTRMGTFYQKGIRWVEGNP